jgi:FkbM family methyltransferase
MIRLVKKLRRKVMSLRKKNPNENAFLKEGKGVIHIGANSGQERALYASFDLNVAWFEPIPAIFDRLVANIAAYPKQKAFNYLLSKEDGVKMILNVSNNDGQSSSIFDLKGHKKMWKNVHYVNKVELESISLPTVIKKENISLDEYDVLVLDTQGSELLILQGATSIVSKFRFIKLEASNFESYQGACMLPELTTWMKSAGFQLVEKTSFAYQIGVGTYYEVLFQRLD